MTTEGRSDTEKVIANISQVADSLSEQVAQLRNFVTVLQAEYDHPAKPGGGDKPA